MMPCVLRSVKSCGRRLAGRGRSQSLAMVETLDESNALPPVAAEDPCGPDLDLEGDAEFLNFIASTGGGDGAGSAGVSSIGEAVRLARRRPRS